MSSQKSQSVPSPDAVHDAWLSQRVELERDLFDGWLPGVQAAPKPAPPQRAVEVVNVRPQPAATPKPVVSQPVAAKPVAAVAPSAPVTENLDPEKARHQQWLQQSNAAAVQQRTQHQQKVSDALSQQREAFLHDLAKQRAAFEQELSARQNEWSAQRDQEWAALKSAKEVQEASVQRLKEELSAQRVKERDELMQWRRQAETELAEARRLFEQDRLKQQQEFARQRETELTQLRRDREEFDTRIRQVQSELAYARQRQEDELRHARETQSAQLRAERAELDKLRDGWLEKFRREQIVLENGMQFFGQHLSRVTDELRTAQRGLQAVSDSATEATPTSLFAAPAPFVNDTRPIEPTVLSLDEIRERLAGIKKPQRAAA